MIKKKIITILILLIAVTGFSQKIQFSKTDKKTGERKIATKDLLIYQHGLDYMQIYLRSFDTTIMLNFISNVGNGVVEKEYVTTLYFDDRAPLKIYPTNKQSYQLSGSQFYRYEYTQDYAISKADLAAIAGKKLVSIKRTFRMTENDKTVSEVDIEIKDKKSDKLGELATVFLEEFNK
jgi:hypothetical protein